VYLGYVINGGKLQINLAKMKFVIKLLDHTKVTKFRIFYGAAQYLWKFIATLLVVVAPLHAITVSSKSLQWVKNQQKDFDELKQNISQALILTLPNL
jgi:hypothetical protein